MEFFAKLFNGFQQLTTYEKNLILDVWVGSECTFAAVSDEHHQYCKEGFQ